MPNKKTLKKNYKKRRTLQGRALQGRALQGRALLTRRRRIVGGGMDEEEYNRQVRRFIHAIKASFSSGRFNLKELNPNLYDIEYRSKEEVGNERDVITLNKCIRFEADINRIDGSKTITLFPREGFDLKNGCTISDDLLINYMIKIANEQQSDLKVANDFFRISLYKEESDPRRGEEWEDEHPCDDKIYSAIPYILLTGQSWLNSLGFKSDQHDEEVEHNQKVREMPLKSYFNRHRDVYTDVIKYLNKHVDDDDKEDEIDRDSSVKEAMMIIKNIGLNQKHDRKAMCKLAKVVSMFDAYGEKKIMYGNELVKKFIKE